jgi:repressor LexA
MLAKSVLSERQAGILRFIEDYARDWGYPPTIREIGDAVRIPSTSVVSYNLKVLQRKGRLTRNPDVSRGLRLVRDAEEAPDGVRLPARPWVVPLLGVIAAGEPIPVPDSDFSATDYEEIAVTPDMVSNPEGVYALKVRGDSMIDALIHDGDVVLMRHQVTADDGDMVAAWIKEERATTLKRFFREHGQTLVRLQPANPSMDPIYLPAGDVEIQGKVIGVIRRLD